MILLYVTYMAFYLVSFVSLALLLFKVNFSLALLTIGFSVLAYLTKFIGELHLLREREAMFAEMQKLTQKEQEVYNTKGMN